MGLKFSYLNVWALARISRITKDDLESIILRYEINNNIDLSTNGNIDLINDTTNESEINTLSELQNNISKLIDNENEEIMIDEDFDPEAKKKALSLKRAEEASMKPDRENIPYYLNESKLIKLLHLFGICESDMDIMINLFRLHDIRGLNHVDLKNILISMSLIITNDSYDCLLLIMLIYDRYKTNMIRKDELYRILKLLNDSAFYFGDKAFKPEQVSDLVDSIFTSAGKVDGYIFYPNFLEFISKHPLIEMFVSPQYQGPIRDKILDDDTIENMNFNDD
eukprot:gene8404-11362_t